MFQAVKTGSHLEMNSEYVILFPIIYSSKAFCKSTWRKSGQTAAQLRT